MTDNGESGAAWEARQAHRSYYEDERATMCRAGTDGDCFWSECPQLADGEPEATGRHCPLDRLPYMTGNGGTP